MGSIADRETARVERYIQYIYIYSGVYAVYWEDRVRRREQNAAPIFPTQTQTRWLRKPKIYITGRASVLQYGIYNEMFSAVEI